MAVAPENENVRYEPDETPPRLVTVGAGLQAAMIIVAPVSITARPSLLDCRFGSARAFRTNGSSLTFWERGSWLCCSETA